jgi:hypothetical protein
MAFPTRKHGNQEIQNCSQSSKRIKTIFSQFRNTHAR